MNSLTCDNLKNMAMNLANGHCFGELVSRLGKELEGKGHPLTDTMLKAGGLALGLGLASGALLGPLGGIAVAGVTFFVSLSWQTLPTEQRALSAFSSSALGQTGVGSSAVQAGNWASRAVRRS